jgi:hypothetical protein
MLEGMGLWLSPLKSLYCRCLHRQMTPPVLHS